MTATEYRFTPVDEAAIRRRIAEVAARWDPLGPRDVLRPVAAGAIGCTPADLRPVEVEWIDREIALALEPARCPVCAVPLSEPVASDECPRPEDHADRPLTRAEAEERGYVVDTYCRPWVAYKGARFRPTEILRIATPAWPAPSGALDDVLALLEDWSRFQVPSFTCREAETLAALLREHRGDLAAEWFLHGHSHGDDEPDDLHHGMPAPAEARS